MSRRSILWLFVCLAEAIFQPVPDGDVSSGPFPERSLELSGARKLQILSHSHICDGTDEQWALCPNLPTCEQCQPIDCTFATWGQWFAAGGCSGLQFRQRNLLVSNNECGQPCDGPKIESRTFLVPECAVNLQSCEFEDWSEWSECASSLDQAMRSRGIAKMNSEGGQACVGPTKMTRSCGGSEAPKICNFTEWQEWSECSTTCGSGRRSRQRHVLPRPHAEEVQPCEGVTAETEECLVELCPSTDCVVSDWTEWQGCKGSTSSQQFRQRTIITAPGPGGSPCPSSLEETAGCDTSTPSCVLTTWSLWSRCDRTCGGGQTTRQRTLQDPGVSTAECGHHKLQEIAPCKTSVCFEAPTDCQLSEWGEWSACSSHCGKGSKQRSRTIAAQAQDGGKSCLGPLVEMDSCMVPSCQIVDCRWSDWSAWSACSCDCGGGTKRRTRAVADAPRNGGKACEPQDKEEVFPCNTQPCGMGCVDAKWGAWGEWTQCSATCSSSFKSRSRSLDVQPSSCGKPASGPRDEYVICDTLPPCVPDLDCELSDWGHWSECSCQCSGIRERNRYISTFASGNGRRCSSSSLKVIEPCNPKPGEEPSPECQKKPPHDCVLSTWEEWSNCTKPCDGGQRERRRMVEQPPSLGGRACEDDLVVTEACNTEVCDNEKCSDCRWGPWEEWGGCSKCGGQKFRHRSVMQMANFCGKPCDVQAAKETTVCKSNCEKSLYCSWTEWSGETTCANCGPATTMRNRALGFSEESPSSGFLFLGTEGGRCAGSQLNVSTCPETGTSCLTCVPKDCEFGEWSSWHAPTCVGLCERFRSIAQTNNECGSPCNGPLLMTKRCPVECQTPQDCSFSNWDDWSACPLLGKNAQRTRSRYIVTQPDHGGEPCVGSLVETGVCPSSEVREDCQLTSWRGWSDCSRTCGEGWKERHRVVDVFAKAGGEQCKGSLSELQSCQDGPQVCPGDEMVDCRLSDWQDWSSCDATSQRKRARDINLARNSGASCEGSLQETASCHEEVVNCSVSAWTQWAECDRSCEGGQSFRQRQVHTFPQNGGETCPSNLKETRGCNTEPCGQQDCVASDWSPWSPCTASCGLGQQSRSRDILANRGSSGRGCEENLGETRPCIGPFQCGRVDCKWGDWSPWSGCTCSCDGGQQTRIRHVAQSPLNGGAPCEAGDKEQMQPCNTQKCSEIQCRDGQWGDWDMWAPCSVSCGGGVTFRHRRVALTANHCGKEPVGLNLELSFCNVGLACDLPTDCEFTSWEMWSACSASCNGVMHRSRRVAVYGRSTGSYCMGGLTETFPCNPGLDEEAPQECQPEPVVDCAFSPWVDWTPCSVSCGGGEHTRSRSILVQASGGGQVCNGNLAEMQECGRKRCYEPPATDCIFGDWEDWGACGKCSGEMRRLRNIVQYASNGGAPCNLTAVEEAKACPRACHAKEYCGWTDWGDWHRCSVSCGTGHRKRARSLELSSDPSTVLNDRAQSVVEEYDALVHQTKALEQSHFMELIVSFSAGSGLVLAALFGLRAWSHGRTLQDAASSRTFSRRVDSLFERGFGSADDLAERGDYLLVGGEHETALPWSVPRYAIDTDEEG